MFNTLINAFKIDSACNTNGFIYNLRKLFIIKNIIPQSLYADELFKSVIRVIVIILQFLWAFASKFLYVGLMIYLPATLINSNVSNNFINILLFLTIIGAFAIPKIIKPDIKKYHSVIVMNMDAKQYALSHYIFYLAKTFISFLVALNFFGKLCNLSNMNVLVLSTLIIALKIMGDSIEVSYYNKKKKVLSKNAWYSSIIVLLGLALAFGLPFINMTIPFNSVIVITLISIISAIFGSMFLIKNNTYKRIYKKEVTLNSIIFDTDQMKVISNQTKMDLKDLKLDEKVEKKKGYDYFNTIFFIRHKNMLLKSAINTALVFLLIAVVTVGVVIFNPAAKEGINSMLMSYLPYFVFVMYIVNRGQLITQAMFFNCDHSMLTYKFYKSPTVILNVFKTRLKTLMSINLIPAMVIAIALPVLLYLSGGTTNVMIYLSLFLSIVFMSLFFSVHHLVLYYLLQPYDMNMKSKSHLFGIINGVTYMACYMCMQITVDTRIFSIGTIAATGIYIALALFLSYKYAPKTFKLK